LDGCPITIAIKTIKKYMYTSKIISHIHKTNKIAMPYPMSPTYLIHRSVYKLLSLVPMTEMD
jgi:hypothetical protein